jgi:hypothetical protein
VRTVFPAIPALGDLTLEYWFTQTAGPWTDNTPWTEYTPVSGAGTNTPVFHLPVGGYTLLVEAYSAGVFLTEGLSATFTVSYANSTPVTVALLAPSDPSIIGGLGGLGTLAYTVTYPAGATLTSLTLTDLDTPATVIDLRVPAAAPGDPAVTYSAGPPATGTVTALPAGYYTLTAALTDATGKTAGHSEVVHIYQGLTTMVDGSLAGGGFAFGEGAFTTPPLTAEEVMNEADFGGAPDGVYAVPGDYDTLRDALDAITSAGLGNYVINLTDDITLTNGINVNVSSAKISLRGGGKSINASDWITMFDSTLILRDITIDGGGSSNIGVSVDGSSAILIMEAGVTITGCPGVGVGVKSGGTFTMHDGAITGNGGGYGGGVLVDEGTFTMTGGTIAGNQSPSTGGGVSIGGSGSSSSFTMSGGTIRDNTAGSGYGGGVAIGDGGTFTMTGGTIHDNTASVSGGGVDVFSGTFDMQGGTIRDNTAGAGGGVNIDSSTFTMSGGTIAGNQSPGPGGGVLIKGDHDTSFDKTGGTIYGDTGGSTANTTAQGATKGHAIAVAVAVGSNLYRDDDVTGNISVTLDSNGDVATQTGAWN